MSNQKGFAPLLIVLIIAIIAAISIIFYQEIQNKTKQTSIPTQLTNSTAPVPIKKTDPPPIQNSNEKVFTSKNCSFRVKIPQDWEVLDYQGARSPEFNDLCTMIEAPDFFDNATNGTSTTTDLSKGLVLNINRTLLGSTFHNVQVNNLDDYISAIETMQEPKVSVKNLQNKTYGNYSGKYFEYSAFENTANFIFINGNYIYTISRNPNYQGIYINSIEAIISGLEF
jgi:hypothetical protein